MKRKSSKLIRAVGILLSVMLAATAWGATLGRVVPIGGQASDIALDEQRGVLYIANFTANRIDVMSLADFTIQTSMNVTAQPGSCSMSPDGRYLLVTHFGNFESPGSQNNALTVIDLETRGKQTFALGSPALGVMFGASNLALVVTTTDFSLFDPVSGVSRLLATIPELAAQTLPAPPASFPPNIVAASLNVSGDGLWIYGLTDTFEFGFDVTSTRISILSFTSSPEQGPRVVAVNQDGSKYLSGWVLHGSAIWDWNLGVWNLAQFPDAEGLLNIGSHAIDSSRGLVYSQVAQEAEDGEEGGQEGPSFPILQVLRDDNLQVLQQIQLTENLAGKSLLSSDRRTMYSISDSGVMVIPVGDLNELPRIQASRQQVLFQTNFCDRQVLTEQITLSDPSGRSTDFALDVTGTGVQVTPPVGTTPATVTIRVDPAAFALSKGTAEATIQITSAGAVNVADEVRVLVNTPEPDQRGTSVSVDGKLVDILADPFRERFFVLRQNTNEVLVYEGQNYEQIATLHTGNTPTQMAVTFDRRYLLVGHDNSQYVAVFDLETLQEAFKVRTPGGHYPRSVAASGAAVLTANRVAGGVHTIDRIDLVARTATELPRLGVWENDIELETMLVSSPNGSSIMAVQDDGHVLLYNANVNDFTISRQDAEELKGAYAASSFDQFVVGDRLMNSSLVTTTLLETGTGETSGFAFVDQTGIRTTTPGISDPGVIQRVDLQSGQGIRATRMAESPVVGTEAFPFTRTLAPLRNRRVIVSLTTSGFTVLPWDYDALVAPPKINDVVNAADYQEPVAPGGLVSIFGHQLSPVNQASNQLPLPTALGESCLTVNGVPMPVLFVSESQINAQIPFNVDGNTTLILRTPGGVSDNFNLTILPTAPAVFRSGSTATLSAVPTVVRQTNGQLVTPANPIHGEDHIVIYLTGMGRTEPPVEAGIPAPLDPLANALIPPIVNLGGVDLPVSFAGLAPGQVGVYQINASVPWWIPDGMQQPLEIVQGGFSTTLNVRVVK